MGLLWHFNIHRCGVNSLIHQTWLYSVWYIMVTLQPRYFKMYGKEARYNESSLQTKTFSWSFLIRLWFILPTKHSIKFEKRIAEERGNKEGVRHFKRAGHAGCYSDISRWRRFETNNLFSRFVLHQIIKNTNRTKLIAFTFKYIWRLVGHNHLRTGGKFQKAPSGTRLLFTHFFSELFSCPKNAPSEKEQNRREDRQRLLMWSSVFVFEIESVSQNWVSLF